MTCLLAIKSCVQVTVRDWFEELVNSHFSKGTPLTAEYLFFDTLGDKLLVPSGRVVVLGLVTWKWDAGNDEINILESFFGSE